MRFSRTCLVVLAIAALNAIVVAGCGSTPVLFGLLDGGSGGQGDGGNVGQDGGGTAQDGGASAVDGGGGGSDGGPATDGGPAPDGGPAQDGGALAGDRCDNAEPVASGATVQGTTAGYAANYAGGQFCAQASQQGSGPERVYSITVPARSRLTVNVRPTAFDVMINIVAAPATNCRTTNMNCLVGQDGPGPGGAETAVYTNSGADAVPVFILVVGYSATDSGAFSLTATLAELGATPVGDTCATAETLTPGTTITGTTVGYTDDYASGTNCATASQQGSGPDRAYTINVPSGKRLSVTATPEAQFDVMLNFYGSAAGCVRTGATCLAGRDSGQPGQVEQLAWSNSSGQLQTVLVVVDGFGPQESGTYQLVATLEDLPAPLDPGDTCQSAPTLVAGTTYSGSTASFANNYGQGTGCVSTGGPDGAYIVDVPAGQRVRVTVTPATQWNPSVSIVAGPAANCDANPRVCLASRDSAGPGGPESVSWVNTASGPQSVYVIVDSSVANQGGAFTIQALTEVAPADDVCEGATALTSGVAVQGTTVGYVNDYVNGNNCAGTAGADRVYSIQVPAGSTLNATVTPTPTAAGAAWDPSLNLVIGPASACGLANRTCAAGSDQGRAGQSEAVTYRNQSGGTQTVFVVVDSASTTATGAGPYTLLASVTAG